METLVVVPQHRNQYYGSYHAYYVHDRFGSPNGGFRDISCRFQASEGILSTPLKSCRVSSSKKKTQTPKKPNPVGSQSEGAKQVVSNRKSTAIPINFRGSNLEKSFSEDLSCSELFAGPVYSNSPPPSSLPIPTFSLRQKRSVSLDLPVKEFGLNIRPIAKSAPTSPRGGSSLSPNSSFRSATVDLRRILNLDISDE